MTFHERFVEKNLKAAVSGSAEQEQAMAGLVEANSNNLQNLGAVTKVEKPAEEISIRVEKIIANTQAIVYLRREIEQKK